MSDDHRTPFKLVTNPKGGGVAKLLVFGMELPTVQSVRVENEIGTDHVKRSRLTIDLTGETEVVREDDGS